mmetsp:Transcript_4115/g.11011  ORF Transcript_4115/g.11011 Transcript_4115/m.11011 type:complete len:570 (+) Transcript_4115:47-1756(+)
MAAISEEALADLEAMGFPVAASRLALLKARGDVSEAANLLLSDPDALAHATDGEGDAASDVVSLTDSDGQADDSELEPPRKQARATIEAGPLQRRLTVMGFQSEAAGQALRSSGGDLERAVAKLLEDSAGQRSNATSRSQGTKEARGKCTAKVCNTVAGADDAEAEAISKCQRLGRKAGGTGRGGRGRRRGLKEVEFAMQAESSLASSGASAASSSSSAAPPSQPSTDEQSNGRTKLTTELMASTLVFGPAAFGPLQRSKASAHVKVDGKDARKLHSKVPHILKASVPGVTEMRGERGLKTVTQMLSDCLMQGLFMHGPPSSPVNGQIIPAVRHIFREMAELPPKDPRRVNRLSALTEACQDCQQVQAREILRIYGEMTTQNETFESQLKYSLVQQKEAALNRFITQKHKKCDLDHTRVQPWQQRPHLFSAYVDIIGEDFGLDGVVAARSDRFLPMALKEVGRVQKQQFMETLRKEMSVKEWLQTLLADINNQSSSADRLINRDCIFKWVQANMSSEAAHRVFYDEERASEFEDHDPKEPMAENRYQPFLSCKVLVEMLVSSEMLKSKA